MYIYIYKAISYTITTTTTIITNKTYNKTKAKVYV